MPHEKMIGPRERLDPDALVILLIGASAVGKSSIAERLCDAGIVEATPTWTTRSPRSGELDTNYDHHFVSDEAFDRQSRIDGFMDERTLYGFRYGVPFLAKPPEGQEALMVLKPLFIPKFIDHFPGARIYQIDASRDEVPLRMKARGQSPADIGKRMQLHDAETADSRRFAHVVFDNNGPLDDTVIQVEAQIAADRASYEGMGTEAGIALAAG